MAEILTCIACGEEVAAVLATRAAYRCHACRDNGRKPLLAPVSHVQPSAVLPVLIRAVTLSRVPSAPSVQNMERC